MELFLHFVNLNIYLGVFKVRLMLISDNQFSALVSFTFNVGAGALQRSTLRMKLNRGEYQNAAGEFPKWRMAGGRVLAGLVRRRAAERALFMA